MWCDRGGFGVGGCEAFQCAASCTRMAGLQGREVAMESAQFVAVRFIVMRALSGFQCFKSDF